MSGDKGIFCLRVDRIMKYLGKSRTPDPQLSHDGHLSTMSEVSPAMILPTSEDVAAVKANLVVLVSRVPYPVSFIVLCIITKRYSTGSMFNIISLYYRQLQHPTLCPLWEL